MQIAEAKFENQFLCLKIKPEESYKFLRQYEKSSAKDYDIVQARHKRSNNANAMAWGLLSKIAARVATPVEDVYRYEIQSIPGLTTVLSIKPEALKAFERAFVADHIGRSVKIIGESEHGVDILCRYGSSDFDTKQMTQFIDLIIADCKAIGIEIPDDDRVRTLLERWDEQCRQ